jgi:hypothetical protein
MLVPRDPKVSKGRLVSRVLLAPRDRMEPLVPREMLVLKGQLVQTESRELLVH